jgi:hypothetical protein
VTDLDKILSGEGETAPAPEATQETKPVETPQAEQQTTEPQDDVVDHADGRKLVPLEALQESRGKIKRYTEQVAEFDKSVSGLKEQNTTLQRQVTELLQRLPQPQKQEPAQAPDIFEDATGAIRHTVAPQFEEMQQVLMANARLVAGVKFTDEKVDEAEKAFIGAMQDKSLDPADYYRVVNSPNRYAAAVQWHQRKVAQAEIGDDPAAFRAKVEAEILAKHGLTQPADTQVQAKPAAAAVMPSNLATARNVGARSGPAWSGPTSLNDIFERKTG